MTFADRGGSANVVQAGVVVSSRGRRLDRRRCRSGPLRPGEATYCRISAQPRGQLHAPRRRTRRCADRCPLPHSGGSARHADRGRRPRSTPAELCTWDDALVGGPPAGAGMAGSGRRLRRPGGRVARRGRVAGWPGSPGGLGDRVGRVIGWVRVAGWPVWPPRRAAVSMAAQPRPNAAVQWRERRAAAVDRTEQAPVEPRSARVRLFGPRTRKGMAGRDCTAQSSPMHAAPSTNPAPTAPGRCRLQHLRGRGGVRRTGRAAWHGGTRPPDRRRRRPAGHHSFRRADAASCDRAEPVCTPRG